MSRTPRHLLGLLLMMMLAASAQADDTQLRKPVVDALKSAAQRHAPVLVDFHAPWCYSCYYMKNKVLNGREWEEVERSAVVIELDADAPEGAYWKERWNVKALPAYVVLNEKGDEIGRILAEQTRGDFYLQLAKIFAAGSTLDELQDEVIKGDAKQGAPAAREVLASYLARRDAAGGLAWYRGLPPPLRENLAKDKLVTLTAARLELQAAAAAGDAPACVATATRVLAGDLGCERAYELDPLLTCSKDLPPADRKKLLSAQRPAMDQLLRSQVFGKGPICADQRSAVLSAADLYDALEDSTAEAVVLDRAIALTEKKIGGDLRADRNLADNLRVYMDRAGKTASLDALYPKLIAAWPEDYVYPYRYGRSLLARGNAAEALPYFEQAAQKAYGVNRLNVAAQRVQALNALGREADARKTVSEALKANGPWFPAEVAKLKALLQTAPKT